MNKKFIYLPNRDKSELLNMLKDTSGDTFYYLVFRIPLFRRPMSAKALEKYVTRGLSKRKRLIFVECKQLSNATHYA